MRLLQNTKIRQLLKKASGIWSLTGLLLALIQVQQNYLYNLACLNMLNCNYYLV